MKIIKEMIIVSFLVVVLLSFNTGALYSHVTEDGDSDNDDGQSYQYGSGDSEDDINSPKGKKGKKKKKKSSVSGLKAEIIYEPENEPSRPSDLPVIEGQEWLYIGRSTSISTCDPPCNEEQECHGWHNHLESIKDRITVEEYERFHGNFWRCIPKT